MRKFGVGVLSVLLVGLAALAGSASAATVTQVTSGLDSPRGLALLPNGTLAVAEAGHGGDVCLGDGGAPPCFGLSSQVSTVDAAAGTHTPLVSGLISLLDPEGGALGVDGLSAQGGRLLAIVGATPVPLDGASCDAGMPSDCASVLAAARDQLGQLLKVTPSGAWKAIAGVGTFGYNFTAENPGGDVFGHEIDSNPYGLLALPGGTLVADAGANTLDRVGNNGDISVVNRFPVPNPPELFPTDAVPTCVARGADGLVVGDLAGRIWRQAGSNWRLVVNETGGNHYTGCAADAAGNVYLVSMFNSSGGPFPNPGTGSLVELAAGANATTTIVDHLVFPNGITIRPGGTFYLTVNSVCPASPGGPCGPLTGAVVKITP